MELRQHHLTPNGFTLVELLITIGVFTIVVVGGTSVLGASRERAGSKAEANTIEQLTKETQQRSLTAVNGDAWGVRCSGNQIIRFSYATATPDIEKTAESIALSPNFSCQTTVPIRFDKLTGFVSSTTTISILYRGAQQSTIEVRSPGVITYVP